MGSEERRGEERCCLGVVPSPDSVTADNGSVEGRGEKRGERRARREMRREKSDKSNEAAIGREGEQEKKVIVKKERGI